MSSDSVFRRTSWVLPVRRSLWRGSNAHSELLSKGPLRSERSPGQDQSAVQAGANRDILGRHLQPAGVLHPRGELWCANGGRRAWMRGPRGTGFSKTDLQPVADGSACPCQLSVSPSPVRPSNAAGD